MDRHLASAHKLDRQGLVPRILDAYFDASGRLRVLVEYWIDPPDSQLVASGCPFGSPCLGMSCLPVGQAELPEAEADPVISRLPRPRDRSGVLFG